MDECKKPPLNDVGRLGLRCPRCGTRDSHVVYTRWTPDDRIVRRRQCGQCGKRITTREQVVGG
jgi:transcriptional regulator NrdR family protein